MKRRLMFMWAAAAALASAPFVAEAQGLLGASGNAGGLLGGLSESNVSGLGAPGGASKGGDWNGGAKGGAKGWDGGSKGGSPKSAWEDSSRSSSSYSNKQQAASSKSSGSKSRYSSFNLRDTTLGGVSADPQISVVKRDFSASKGGEQHTGSKGGSGASFHQAAQGSTKAFTASFPIAVQPTTIGGFSQEKAAASTWDNRQSSYSSATHAQSNHSALSKGFVQGALLH
jgi:hypothetical protein